MPQLPGLDIGWKQGEKTTNPIRDALCELDRRGQKTNAGYYDYKNVIATPILRQTTGWRTANYGGTTSDPRLNYTLATSSGYANTVKGVAAANIGKVMGVATASISKVNGV